MINIIVAVTKDFGIGANNQLLFHIKEDLQRFKKLTTGHKIIMGRKTLESLPHLLPNREHIVLTRDKELVIEGVTIINDIQNIVKKYKDSKEVVFVIGGGEIYKQFLPYCDKIYLTFIKEIPKTEPDTFFHFNQKNDFVPIGIQKGLDSKIKYSFITYKRIY